MLIKDVKTAFKIADVKLIKNSTKLNFVYLSKIIDENNQVLPKNILTKNYSRVYIIVVDGLIKKIGGSQARGGIKNTLEIYKDGGVNGRPSIRSFGVWYFLYHTLLSGKKIEFYMIYHKDFDFKVKGLFGLNQITNANINYKLIEEQCIKDYLNVENGKYPDWNIQEQGMDWPEIIKNEHSEITTNSLKSNSKRKKARM
ncbi:MAG: hypothetical protein PWQ56_406 [Patescibacteria group bacterium]|nr:hypothetical protein [Patescibacteria group bacterium]